MLIRDVLTSKSSLVVTVGPDATVLEAARTLVHHSFGSLVVVKGGEILGIITERDVLRLAARDPGGLGSTPVSTVMTTELVVGLADDEIAYGMAVMTNNRVRHLPVVEGKRLVGIVSIGDLVNASLADLQAENRWLKDYVQGGG
ncbi:MAG: CBS domain-containing protein [Longimicrobiales bacterium]